MAQPQQARSSCTKNLDNDPRPRSGGLVIATGSLCCDSRRRRSPCPRPSTRPIACASCSPIASTALQPSVEESRGLGYSRLREQPWTAAWLASLATSCPGRSRREHARNAAGYRVDPTRALRYHHASGEGVLEESHAFLVADGLAVMLKDERDGNESGQVYWWARPSGQRPARSTTTPQQPLRPSPWKNWWPGHRGRHPRCSTRPAPTILRYERYLDQQPRPGGQ